jgi:hypothetical protein
VKTWLWLFCGKTQTLVATFLAGAGAHGGPLARVVQALRADGTIGGMKGHAT